MAARVGRRVGSAFAGAWAHPRIPWSFPPPFLTRSAPLTSSRPLVILLVPREMTNGVPAKERVMAAEVSCRDILVSLLANSDWEAIGISDLIGKVQAASRRMKAFGVPCLFVAHRTNSDRYWSDEASYELGLLGSMGLLRLRSSRVEKTGVDYHQYVEMLCGQLPDRTKNMLTQVTR